MVLSKPQMHLYIKAGTDQGVFRFWNCWGSLQTPSISACAECLSWTDALATGTRNWQVSSGVVADVDVDVSTTKPATLTNAPILALTLAVVMPQSIDQDQCCAAAGNVTATRRTDYGQQRLATYDQLITLSRYCVQSKRATTGSLRPI